MICKKGIDRFSLVKNKFCLVINPLKFPMVKKILIF